MHNLHLSGLAVHFDLGAHPARHPKQGRGGQRRLWVIGNLDHAAANEFEPGAAKVLRDHRLERMSIVAAPNGPIVERQLGRRAAEPLGGEFEDLVAGIGRRSHDGDAGDHGAAAGMRAIVEGRRVGVDRAVAHPIEREI